MLTICLSVLGLSLVLNFYLFMKWMNKEVALLEHHSLILEAVKSFEKDKHCLIDLQQIDPQNVYLRSPGR